MTLVEVEARANFAQVRVVVGLEYVFAEMEFGVVAVVEYVVVAELVAACALAVGKQEAWIAFFGLVDMSVEPENAVVEAGGGHK